MTSVAFWRKMKQGQILARWYVVERGDLSGEALSTIDSLYRRSVTREYIRLVNSVRENVRMAGNRILQWASEEKLSYAAR